LRVRGREEDKGKGQGNLGISSNVIGRAINSDDAIDEMAKTKRERRCRRYRKGYGHRCRSQGRDIISVGPYMSCCTEVPEGQSEFIRR